MPSAEPTDALSVSRLRSVARWLLSSAHKTRVVQWRTAYRLAFTRKDIGRDTYIDRTVQVLGWDAVSIGRFCAISEGTWLNVNRRVPGHKHIVIGDNCYVGRRNFFTSGWQIVLGDYCMTGVDCKLMSGDHTFDSPLVPYVISAVTNDKVIRLGVNARMGAGSSIVGNVTVGHGSIVGAGALVIKDVPPFSIVIGVPARVYRRYDFVTGGWIDPADFGDAQERAMPDEASYRSALRTKYPRLFIPLQAAGRSFGDMP